MLFKSGTKWPSCYNSFLNQAVVIEIPMNAQLLFLYTHLIIIMIGHQSFHCSSNHHASPFHLSFNERFLCEIFYKLEQLAPMIFFTIENGKKGGGHFWGFIDITILTIQFIKITIHFLDFISYGKGESTGVLIFISFQFYFRRIF